MKGAAVPGTYCLGNVDGDLARVGRGMAGGDDELGGVGGIGRAEGAFVASDAGVDTCCRRSSW